MSIAKTPTQKICTYTPKLVESQNVVESDATQLLDAPPIIRYRQNKLSVTDFSAQLWCETQMEYYLKTGKKRETAAMRSGTARHLELEAADHDTEEILVESQEELLGIRLLNANRLLDQLLMTGKAREVWVFGLFGDTLVRGIIDELEIRQISKSNATVVISDTKTRRKQMEPTAPQKRASALQLQTYHLLLSSLRIGETDFSKLSEIYKCDPSFKFTKTPLDEFEDLDDLMRSTREVFMSLPPINSETEISYDFEGVEFARNRISSNVRSTLYVLHDLLSWWHGERTSESVVSSESWKCKWCEFLEECSATPLPATAKAAHLQMQREAAEEEKRTEEAKSLPTQASPKPMLRRPVTSSAAGCRSRDILLDNRGGFFSVSVNELLVELNEGRPTPFASTVVIHPRAQLKLPKANIPCQNRLKKRSE